MSDHVSARLVAVLVLAFDLIPAVAWTFGDPVRTSGPAYARARSIFNWLPGDPSRWWGGLLLVLTVVALVALVGHSELWARYAFVPLLTYWAVWAFFYGWSVLTAGADWSRIGLALIACVGHWRPLAAPQRLTRPGHAPHAG